MITFTTRQAAVHLGYSKQGVTNLCAAGAFPNAYKDNYRWHIPLDDIAAFKQARPDRYGTCPRCGILTDGVVCDDCRRERAGGGYRWYEVNLYGVGVRQGGVKL